MISKTLGCWFLGLLNVCNIVVNEFNSDFFLKQIRSDSIGHLIISRCLPETISLYLSL
ncbi:hypothetical protein BJQ96_03560 [Flavobacterium sp. PL0002]|nr:hypothetical protein [Flavobacterium sp. PL002]